MNMKTIRLCNAAIILAGLGVAARPLPAGAANLSKAVVTQKVNKVTLAESATAAPQPVSPGAVVKDANIVRTGVQSRAELEFADKTLTRLGANTIFSFDAGASVLDFKEGAALFCKPKGTGPLQIRSAAVTAAITGTTGFVSALPSKKKKMKGVPDDVVMLGILEGSLKGKSSWIDAKGQQHAFDFRLGPGDMLVAEPGLQPVIVQFDLPRFIATSPLVNGFANPLPNAVQIAREVAAFQTLASRGFIDPQNTVVATYNHQVFFATAGPRSPTGFDAGVNQLTAINNLNNRPGTPGGGVQTVVLAPTPPLLASNNSSGSGGFLPVGGSANIRGQLVWQTSADLDLHLVLPDNQEVYFANRTVSFNAGAATGTLDADNLGGVINVPPNQRVENLVVTGTPSSGNYSFFVRSFSTPNPSDPCTLLVTGNGGLTTQTLNCNLGPGQNSTHLNVTVP